MRAIAFILVSLALAQHPMSADEPDAVEKITSVGRVPEETTLAAPTAFATRIELDGRRMELETAPDLLAESVGVQVRRFGGLGAFSTISIRGSSPNQVQFFLDGVPLSLARNDTLNLALLPIDSVDAIEIYRGTVPIAFGGNGGGSVVNLVTRAASDQPSSEILAGYGNFDTYRLSALHTRRIGAVELLAQLGALGSDGDFEFRSFNGSQENPDDDFDKVRVNNDFDSATLLVKARAHWSPTTRAHLTQEAMVRDAGVPGPDPRQIEGSRQQNIRSVTNLGIELDSFLSPDISAALNAFATYQQLDFDDREAGFGPTQDTVDRSVAYGANTRGDYFGAPLQTLSWFAEIVHENFDPYSETATPRDLPDQRRLRTSVALQDHVQLFGDRLSIVPAIRYHHIEDDFSAASIAGRPEAPAQNVARNLWSPSIGLAFALTDWLEVKGNLGRFERPPNFSELFGNIGLVASNFDLVPETIVQRDIGFRLTTDAIPAVQSLLLEYAYFNNDADDLIVFRAVNPQKIKAENFEAARIRGHEISTRIELEKYVTLTANYTRQDSVNLSSEPSRFGNPLPLLPRDELYLRLQAAMGIAALHYEYNLTGHSTTTPSNLDPIVGRRVHNIGMALEFMDHFAVAFEVLNVGDETIRDLIDFPLPGRVFQGTVRARF